MVRALSIACAVLALAVAALALQVHDAQRRIDALESSRATPAPTAHAIAQRDDDDDDDSAGPSGSGASASAAHASFFGRPIPDAHASPPPASSTASTSAPASGAPEARGEVADLVRGEMQRLDDEKMQAREERQRKRIHKELDDLQQSVNLTTEQRTQVQTMMEAELVEMRQAFQDARDNDSWADLREKMRTTRQKTDDNVNAFLDTDEKKQAYSAMREDERSRFLGALRGNRGE